MLEFLSALFRRKRPDEALDEEFNAHLDELTEEFIRSGYSPEEARYQARRQFGNRTGLLEESREIWHVRWLGALRRDLRFAWRLARRQPWTVAAIVASISIGVGANTAITSVLDTALLNPLGLRNADRIVAATVHLKKLRMMDAETSAAELRDLQAMNDVFRAVAATERRAWTLQAGTPSRLIGVAVTADFFRVFDQKPALGSFFDGSDPNEIVLSHNLWISLFGGSSSALGEKILLDGKLFRISGVARPDFHFPSSAEAWVPLVLTPDRFKRGMNMVLSPFARLREGISPRQAQERVDRAVGNLMASTGGAELRKFEYGIDVRPISLRIAGDLRRPLWLLWSAALVLLLAACANVAGLLLARAGGRRKEIAVRISLGAGKLEILRQLLTESLLLALLGAIGGLLLAAFSLQLLKQAPLPQQPLLSLTGLNVRLLFYGLFLAIASSIIFGTVPAAELLRERHVTAMARAGREWFRNIYLVGQVSAAMLLVALTGLLLKSLKTIESIQPGFDAGDVTTAFIIKPAANQNTFYERLLTRLRATPGVQAAALAYSLPFGGDAPTSLFDIKGRHHLAGEPEWHAEAYQVSPGYFEALHIRLLRGRAVSEFDTVRSAPVCVIDKNLAERFFPNEDPIGQEIRMYGGARIVGIVSTVRDTTLESASRPVVYYPLAQIPYFPQLGIVVRSSLPSGSLIRKAVHDANSSIAVFDVKTMEERIDASLVTRSWIAWLVAVFSGVSMLLAALGIHAAIAQAVTERTAEIGIRMALGARPVDILRHYVVQGLRLVAAGIVVALFAATCCRQWLSDFLYRVQPFDSGMWIVSIAGVLAISVIAVLVPSWRASRIDPQAALRSE